ncbi:MAG: hypothetical protein ACM31N_02715 [Deltaproteobacteria bacterium]
MMRPVSIICSLGAIVALAFFLSCPSRVEAESLRATPSLLLEERWDSNVFNASDNEVSDFVTRATPRLALSYAVLGDNVVLRGAIELEKHADRTELDTNTATKSLELTTGGPIRLTERFSLTPYARFLETRDTFRRNELTQLPDAGGIPPESLVNVRQKVREYSGNLQTVYLLTPKLQLGVGAGGNRREFPDETTNLQGSRSITGNASLNHRFTPVFSSGLYTETTYTSFDSAPNSRIYAGGLTAAYDVTENYKVEARAGAGYLRQSTGVGDDTDTDFSPNGRLSITYSKLDFRARLFGNYEFSGAGSFGKPTKRGNVTASFTDQFAPRWFWDLAGYYQTNRSTDEQVTEDLVTASGTAGIRYQAATWAIVNLSGNVNRQWSHGVTGTSLKREYIMIGLELSTTYPVF